MGRTQEERRTETRGLLLDAAADLFARQGFHATSAEAVAGAAGRTTGALYDHFGGKPGLLVALLEQWIDQTVTDLSASLQSERDLDDRLRALWDGVIRRDNESGDAWLLLEFELWLHAVRDPEMGEVGAQRFAVMRRGLAGGLEDWSAEFGFELPGPAPELAAQVIALLVGLAFQYRIDAAAVSQTAVTGGLRRLLGLPAAHRPASRPSRSDAPTPQPMPRHRSRSQADELEAHPAPT